MLPKAKMRSNQHLTVKPLKVKSLIKSFAGKQKKMKINK